MQAQRLFVDRVMKAAWADHERDLERRGLVEDQDAANLLFLREATLRRKLATGEWTVPTQVYVAVMMRGDER